MGACPCRLVGESREAGVGGVLLSEVRSVRWGDELERAWGTYDRRRGQGAFRMVEEAFGPCDLLYWLVGVPCGWKCGGVRVRVYLGIRTVVVDRRSRVFATWGLRPLGPRPRRRMLWSQLRIVLFRGRFLVMVEVLIL